jgi:hypothetical protein
MPLAAAIIGAAVIGGVADVASSSSAANAASNAASQNNALEQQIYEQNSANEKPYIQSGDTAETALNGFLGLGGDPAATQAAFNNYLNSTGYQFNLNQGLDAAEQSQVARGMGNSGATLKALDTYGTGLADTYGQQYVGNLQNEVNTGVSATNALAGEGQNYANAVSSNNNSAASATGNAAIASGNAFNGILSSALSAYGLSRGGSSFGGGSSGGGYNAFAPGG